MKWLLRIKVSEGANEKLRQWSTLYTCSLFRTNYRPCTLYNGKVYVLTRVLSVCPHLGGYLGQVQAGGYPNQVRRRGGYPSQVGCPPRVPPARSGTEDYLGYLPRDRTAHGVLDKRQSVCLLRSRRTTVLFASGCMPRGTSRSQTNLVVNPDDYFQYVRFPVLEVTRTR